MFTLRTIEHWSFAAFLIVLLQPIAIFMMAALIVPRTASERAVDLKDDYLRESRWFFSALLLALFASLAKNLVLTGKLPEPRNLGAHTTLCWHLNRSARIQVSACPLILAVAGLALLSGYIALLLTMLS